MSNETLVDVDTLRAQVRVKYRDVGSGAGFDSFIAAHQVGATGRVIGVDMTPEMLGKSRTTDKQAVFAEIFRVLRPGGVLQFADIANGRLVPIEAMRDVDLWTG